MAENCIKLHKLNTCEVYFIKYISFFIIESEKD